MSARGHRRTARTATAVVITAVTLSACTTSIAGRAIRAAKPATAPISARDLLLPNGDSTPRGPATATAVGDNYFTSARPPECAAALLFKGSPLRPAGSSDHAESAYRLAGAALYAESADVYETALSARKVVSNGFSAVSQCHTAAVGVSPQGVFKPMRLSFFGTTDDGVLVVDHDPSGLDLQLRAGRGPASGPADVALRQQVRIPDGGVGVEKEGATRPRRRLTTTGRVNARITPIWTPPTCSTELLPGRYYRALRSPEWDLPWVPHRPSPRRYMALCQKTGQCRPAQPGHTHAARKMNRAAFTHKRVADARQTFLSGTRLAATRGTASSGGMEMPPPPFGRVVHRHRRRCKSRGAGFLSCVQEHRDQCASPIHARDYAERELMAKNRAETRRDFTLGRTSARGRTGAGRRARRNGTRAARSRTFLGVVLVHRRMVSPAGLRSPARPRQSTGLVFAPYPQIGEASRER